MNISIIGAGNVGKALGSAFAAAGNDVTFASRDAARAAAAASAAGGRAATTFAEAAAGADIVVLAVPGSAVEAVAAEIAPVVAGKVVIDTTNPIRPDFSGLSTDGGPSGAERLATLLPGAHVVKAFNTLFAGNQANPAGQGQVLDALFATDDEGARATVAALASSIGFRPVHVGPLAAARELEAMAWLNIRLQVITGGTWQTAFVLVSPPPAATAA
jgi:8-hydroxy-5-deazaflavin:NADPH oxidoreductase